MLSLIGNKYKAINIGLYKDAEFAVFKNISNPHSEKNQKDFPKNV